MTQKIRVYTDFSGCLKGGRGARAPGKGEGCRERFETVPYLIHNSKMFK
jgi:hypothetical protein